MGFLVYQHVVLCDSLKAALVEKLFFLFAQNMLSVPFLWSASFFPPTHLIEGDMAVSYTVYTLFFPTIFSNHHKILVHCFGMPFLKNMTLKICFIVELFLSCTRITSGQPEKESTSINKSPTPVMYAWSICTWLHGSTSLGHEYKVISVKFLNSLHFLHLFIYSSTFHEYLSHPPSNFILFRVAATPQCTSSCTLFITNNLCVSGGIIRSPLQITPCSIVDLCLISLLGLSTREQISPRFFLFSMLSDLVLDHV